MLKLAVRSARVPTVVATLVIALSLQAVAGQAPPNFGGILGAILNTAMKEQLTAEWQNRPLADYSCLEAHNLSADLGKFVAFDSWTTILHSNTNIAAFILQDVMPAYFPPGNVERELDRLSQYFGQRARVITGESRSDAPHSL
jgi:hypothetical protein